MLLFEKKGVRSSFLSVALVSQTVLLEGLNILWCTWAFIVSNVLSTVNLSPLDSYCNCSVRYQCVSVSFRQISSTLSLPVLMTPVIFILYYWTWNHRCCERQINLNLFPETSLTPTESPQVTFATLMICACRLGVVMVTGGCIGYRPEGSLQQ